MPIMYYFCTYPVQACFWREIRINFLNLLKDEKISNRKSFVPEPPNKTQFKIKMPGLIKDSYNKGM